MLLRPLSMSISKANRYTIGNFSFLNFNLASYLHPFSAKISRHVILDSHSETRYMIIQIMLHNGNDLQYSEFSSAYSIIHKKEKVRIKNSCLSIDALQSSVKISSRYHFPLNDHTKLYIGVFPKCL
jgi:hypothetical protein